MTPTVVIALDIDAMRKIVSVRIGFLPSTSWNPNVDGTHALLTPFTQYSQIYLNNQNPIEFLESVYSALPVSVVTEVGLSLAPKGTGTEALD